MRDNYARYEANERRKHSCRVLRNLLRMWMHHYDFPATSKRALSSHTSVHIYSYKGHGRDIHRRIHEIKVETEFCFRGL